MLAAKACCCRKPNAACTSCMFDRLLTQPVMEHPSCCSTDMECVVNDAIAHGCPAAAALKAGRVAIAAGRPGNCARSSVLTCIIQADEAGTVEG